MSGKKIVKISLILFFFLIVILFIYLKFSKKNEIILQDPETQEEINYTSNIIKDINYVTKDINGNEYIITALEGEIDYNNSNTLFLTKVKASIKLKNDEIITIQSDYGKYNSDNFDTIFSKNVIIEYLNNKINGDYLDFSIKRNSMIITKNVIYTDTENTLKTDVVEIDLNTKDANFYMYDKNKKINIINQKSDGNN